MFHLKFISDLIKASYLQIKNNMISEKESSISENDNYENNSESDSKDESITISSQSSNER